MHYLYGVRPIGFSSLYRHLAVLLLFVVVASPQREYIFRMGMRIKRKENAVKRIRTFLTEYKNHHRVRPCFSACLCWGHIEIY